MKPMELKFTFWVLGIVLLGVAPCQAQSIARDRCAVYFEVLWNKAVKGVWDPSSYEPAWFWNQMPADQAKWWQGKGRQKYAQICSTQDFQQADYVVEVGNVVSSWSTSVTQTTWGSTWNFGNISTKSGVVAKSKTYSYSTIWPVVKQDGKATVAKSPGFTFLGKPRNVFEDAIKHLAKDHSAR